MIYYFIILLSETLVVLLLNIPMIIGAYTFSQRAAGNIFYLKIAMTVFLYLLQALLIFSLLGLVGFLSLAGALAGSIVCSILLLWASQKLPEIHQEPAFSSTTYSERFIGYMLFFILSVITCKTTCFGGTDTFLYHLFYPAMWLANQKIYAISLTGLPHEYFPIAGEVMYGWLSLPGSRQPFITILQPLALAMAIFAAAGFWKRLQIPQLFIKSGLLLFAAISIIQENASLCYTDVLTGSFLVTGIIFMLTAFKIPENSVTIKKIFSACSGLALGITSAIKYSGLIMAPVSGLVLLVYFFISDKKSAMLKKNLSIYCIFIISALFSALSFYMPNWIKTGNPFYPVKIPFIFSNGIDFERPATALSNLWEYYVNNDMWSFNPFTGLFYSGLILLIIFYSVNNLLRKKRCIICDTMCIVLLAAVVAETIMIAIYPTMTGSRQIIPFLSVVGILIPGVIYLVAEKFLKKKIHVFIYLIIILLIDFFTVKNQHSIYSVITNSTSIILSLILAYPDSARARKLITICAGIFFFLSLFAWSFYSWLTSPVAVRQFAGDDNYEIIMHLRKEYTTRKQSLNIASSGYLFNYMLMWDMSGNRVFNIPINQANTSHPHEVTTLEDLRENNIDYSLWLKRLRANNIEFLVIDLISHQDFARNRDIELRWAQNHPEQFLPIFSGNGVYLFKIKY